MAVWGIDIGKSALKAIKLRPTAEGLEILAVEHISYPIEEDEDERNEQVAEALRTFQSKHKVSGSTVSVGLAGLHAFSRFIKLPPVEGSKVAQLVRLEAQQQIPFPIAEVNWDFVRLPQEDPGEEIEVGIFATRSELVDGYLSDLREGGINPDIVTIAPLAIYNFIRANGNDEEGAAIILDIGAEHTDLVIVDGERFWIRNLRIAGNDITKALADRFKVPFAEAEKLKRNSSKSAQAKKIFGTMEPVLKDLVGEIHRSVGFFKSQADGLKVRRLVLLGDGAKLKNLPKFLREQLRYKVTRVQQLAEDRFVIDPDVELDVLKKHLLGFGVALGLAVQGANEAHCSINLAPQQVQIQSQLRSKVPWAVGAAACAWAAFGLGYLHQTSMLEQVHAAQKETQGLPDIGGIQNEVQALQDLGPIERKAQAYNALGEGRTLVLELMNAVRGLLPQHNDALPEWNYQQHATEDLDTQVENYESLVIQSGVHLKKLWLLQWNIENLKDEDAPNRYKVEMLVAKPVPRGSESKLADLREEVGREFVKPLINKLAPAPFYVRDAESTDLYGEKGRSYLGILTEIFALHPDERNDNNSPERFHCIVVPVTFEIGVPPPPAPPPPQEGEGGETNPDDQGGS